MRIDAAYKYDHCRGELGRGHVGRCPRGWLLDAQRHARSLGDTNMVEACEIALHVQRSGSTRNPRQREMQRLAGRKLGPREVAR